MNNSVILDLLAFQRGYINALVEDVPDEMMSVQAGGIVNHPAWQLGHLSWSLDRFCQAMGAASKVDAAWTQKYGRDSVPTSDRASYAGKAELLRILDERRGEFARLFKTANPDDLAKPPPDPKIAKRFPTLGMLLVFGATSHEGSHLGQVAAWRTAMGMVPALSKM
jgi:hypothetical protein